MDTMTYFQANAATAIPIIEGCRDYTLDELIAGGANPDHAREVLELTATYYGKTTCSRKQRDARDAALTHGHDIPTMIKIEGYIKRIKTIHEAWGLRARLCDTPKEEITKVARAYFRAHRPPGPKPGVRITRRRDGNHTLSITSTSLDIADMNAVLASLNRDDALAAVKTVFFDNPATTVPTITTNVTLNLNQLDKVTAGHGDDVTLTLSNGATMTGAQLVTRVLEEHGYVTLVHPVQGPVNLYRTRRFANDKQRQMLTNLYPRCVWPDCNKPVEECEYHHVKGWNAGGMTNINNLVPLCPHHNGVNNDADVPWHRRGKIVLRDGKPVWQAPAYARGR